MISIVNPLKGSPVSGKFRVQVRVFNPGGIANISGLALSDNDGATYAYTTATTLSTFDTPKIGTVTGRTFEFQITPAAGLRALRARVTNAVVTPTFVLSNGVSVNVLAARTGDGTLLVRDNSSQLCSDCHAGVMTHSSEATGTEFGSWATTCRDCHTAHATTNVGLVRGTVSAPAVGANPPTNRPVDFKKIDGGYTATPSLPSNPSGFANGTSPASGVCQVCHTRTQYYRQDGFDYPLPGQLQTASGGHYPSEPGGCGSCHKHTAGLQADCSGCHGDNSATPRTTFSKTAPPRDTCGNWDALTNLGNGPNRVGAHAKHLTGGTYSNAVACAQCHTNPPTSASNPNHGGTTCGTNLTTDRAVMTWGTLATGGVDVWSAPATTPTATKSTTSPTTCSNTYCHGRFPNGNNATPAWNGTAACGTCHGLPPPVTADVTKNHPNNTSCDKCHGAGYSTTAVNKVTHIDGQLQKPNKGCASCHGELTVADGTNVLPGDTRSAPGYAGTGVDTTGNALVTVAGVGAHRAHIEPTSATGAAPAIACTQCHVQPLEGNTDHADAAFDWNWGSIARDGIRLSPTYSSATKQCSSVYCHSNANPLGGLDSVPSTQAWTDGTNMGCASCHQVAVYGSTGLSAKHERHVSNVTGYGYGCVRCHVNTAATNASIVTGGGQHVDGTRDVDFDASGPDNSLGGYNYGTYQCSSIYCHSDGVNRAKPFTSALIAWNGTTNCSSCHLSGAAMATNAHQAHVNQAATYGTTWGCQTCHYPTTHDGTSIFATGNHANALSDVEGAAAGTLKYQDVGNTAPNSCTTYCHSAGRDPLATAQYYSDMNWKATALSGCSSCHGRFSPADPLFATSYGAPNYTSGGTATATANSHRKHVSGPGDCYTCHKATVNAAGNAIVSATAHLDGSRQVSFDALAAGAGAVYSNDVNKRCSSVSCHPSGPVQWGGPTQTCASCHLRATANGGDQNDFAGISNGIAALVNTEEWTNFGHGSSGATFLDAGEFGQAGITNRCVYCHDDQNSSANHKQTGNPFRLRGKAAAGGATALYDTTTLPLTDAVCLNCHDISANSPAGVDPDGAGGQPPVGPATTRISAYHAGGKHKADDGGQRCWDCHDPHGDGSNIKMIGADLLVWSSDASGYAGTRSTDAPQSAPVSFTLSGIGGYTDTVGPPYNGVCQVCHRTTDHLSAATGMLYWLSDGTGSHNADQDCVSCHTHQQPPNNAFAGAGACSSCHLAVADAGTNSDRDEFPPSTTSTLKSWVDREDWYATGHGRTATNYTQSNNPPANFPAPTQTVEPCYYCHAPDSALFTGGETSKHTDVAAGNPFRLANTAVATKPAWGKNGNCLICHGADATGFDPDGAAKLDYGSIIGAKRISATHYGAKHDATHDGGTLCWDCHDPHGDKNYTTGREVAYMVQLQPLIDSADAWGASGTFVSAANAVDFNMAKAGVTTTLEGQDYVSAVAPYNGVCQVCHTNGVAPGPVTYWTAAGGGTTHENGGARCTACHGHEQTPNLAFKQVDAASCGTCHPNPPGGGRHASHLATNVSTTYGDTTFRSSATAYSFGCGKCHQTPASVHYDDVGGTLADPYRADVAFDLNNGTAATYALAGTVATEIGSTTPALYFGTQNGTCSSTYCHDPLGTAYEAIDGQMSVAWNTASTLACTGCHDDATGQASTKLPYAHGKHATNATGAYNYICQTCHANTVDGTNAVTSRVNHVNNNKNDVKFTTGGGINQATGTFSGGATGTCSATYCHSNGQSQTSFATSVSPAWNGAGGCAICHGTGNAATTTLSAAHFRHVDAVANDGYGYTCDRCHTSTVNSTNTVIWSAGVTQHVDGDVDGDVKFNALPISQPVATYAAATSQCNSTYCHSNGQTLVSPFASNVSIAWTAAGGCDKCHGTRGGATTTLGGKHAIHVNATASSGYNYDCVVCHTNTGGTVAGITNKANHVDADASHDVAFSTLFSQNAATYDYTTTLQCNNTYCHSNGVNRTTPPFTNASIAWSATKSCVSCHKGDASQTGNVMGTNGGTARHANHVNNTALIGANVQCGTCHGATVTGNTAPTATFYSTNHVNQSPDVALGTVGGKSGGAYDGTGHTCSTNWCHSSGEATPQYVPADWDLTWTAGTVCLGCHGAFPSTDARYSFASKAGEPNYINGGIATATANSHGAHVSLTSGTECYMCHKNTADVAGNKVPTTATQHFNGVQDVALDTANAKVGATATYTPGVGTKTCANVVCHGGPGSTVKWGDPNVTCRTCHMKSGVGVDNDTDDYNYGNNVVAAVDQEDWLAFGHGATAAYTESGNPRANFDNSGATAVDGCLYCHDSLANGGADHGAATNPFRLKNTGGADGKNGACLICHKTSSTGVTVAGVARNRTTSPVVAEDHYGALHTANGKGGQLCWDCHDPHGDYNYASTAANKRIANMIQEQPVRTHATVADPNGWGIPDPATELAPTPDFRADRDGTAGWAWGDYVSNTLVPATTGTYRGVCQVCHTATSVFRQTTYLATHYNTGTPACTATCHTHSHVPVSTDNAFKAPDCRTCHGTQTQDDTTVTGSTRAVDADFALQSHHVGNGGTFMGGTLTNNDCAVCHAEATVAVQGGSVSVNGALHKNSKVDLRDADSATGGYFQYDYVTIKALATTAANSGNASWKQETSGRSDDLVGAPSVACTPTGTGCSKGLDRFCISCHDADGASQAYLEGDSAATASNPFADGMITNEYDQANRVKVVDIASRIHETARTSAGGAWPSTDRDVATQPGTSPAGRGTDTRKDPPYGVFSRHAIRGLSVSVYGGTNANWDGATYFNQTKFTWASNSVMGCADCHTVDGANKTAGNAHGSGSEYLLKDISGTAAEGAMGSRGSGGTYVCYACHPQAKYTPGQGHTNNSSDFQDYSASTGSARVTLSTSGGNVYGYACGNCHGGGAPTKAGATPPTGLTSTTLDGGVPTSTTIGGFGTIHGTSQVIGIGTNGGSAGTAYRAAYRFMNGNSMRYYDPGTWSGGTKTCYTLNTAADQWGACNKHGTGVGYSAQPPTTRPLAY
jgi:predicted CxxxxCH...CXXCH cytochrome family protein